MSTARRVGFALAGILLGDFVGGVIGLLGGLSYTTLAQTSGFEGHSGLVVAAWLLAGIVIGTIVGLVMGLKRAPRS